MSDIFKRSGEPLDRFKTDDDKCIVDSEFLAAHQFKSVVSCSDGKFVDHRSDLRAKGQALIRQKFAADRPVVDLQIEQFDRAYLSSSPVEISAWRK